jgi:hypothetical protein
MLPGEPVRIPPWAFPTYSWPVSARSLSPLRPLRVVEVMATRHVVEAVPASPRQGRTVRLDGGVG